MIAVELPIIQQLSIKTFVPAGNNRIHTLQCLYLLQFFSIPFSPFIKERFESYRKIKNKDYEKR